MDSLMVAQATDIPTLGGRFTFFQIAYVTNDLERAMRAQGALYGASRFQVNRDVEIETRAGTARASFALAFVGAQQLEIIEPCGGADATYRDGLPARGFGMHLHHAGCLLTERSEWDRVRTAITQGYETPVGGIFRYEGVPLMHYLYADTRAHLGHYLEFMYQTEAGRDLFAQVPRF